MERVAHCCQVTAKEQGSASRPQATIQAVLPHLPSPSSLMVPLLKCIWRMCLARGSFSFSCHPTGIYVPGRICRMCSSVWVGKLPSLMLLEYMMFANEAQPSLPVQLDIQFQDSVSSSIPRDFRQVVLAWFPCPRGLGCVGYQGNLPSFT